jgi:hypothetical protein
MKPKNTKVCSYFSAVVASYNLRDGFIGIGWGSCWWWFRDAGGVVHIPPSHGSGVQGGANFLIECFLFGKACLWNCQTGLPTRLSSAVAPFRDYALGQRQHHETWPKLDENPLVPDLAGAIPAQASKLHQNYIFNTWWRLLTHNFAAWSKTNGSFGRSSWHCFRTNTAIEYYEKKPHFLTVHYLKNSVMEITTVIIFLYCTFRAFAKARPNWNHKWNSSKANFIARSKH